MTITNNGGSNSNPSSKPGTPKPPELPATSGEGDQNKDQVYQSTTAVVRAVMEMTRGVQQAKAEQYVDLVKVRYDTRIHTVPYL